MPYPGDWSIILVVYLKNRKIGFPLEMDFCLRFRLTCRCDPGCDPDRVTPIVKRMVITALSVKHHTKIRIFSFSRQAIARKMLS